MILSCFQDFGTGLAVWVPFSHFVKNLMIENLKRGHLNLQTCAAGDTKQLLVINQQGRSYMVLFQYQSISI